VPHILSSFLPVSSSLHEMLTLELTIRSY
jgi:hypothetical protein